MMHSRQINADYGPFLQTLSSRFKKADLAVANMEFTLGGKPYSGYPSFSAPDKYAEYVFQQGINVFLTANNHILDKGTSGLTRTISIYDSMEKEGKIRFTGIAKDSHQDSCSYPLLFNIKGIRLALINFTYGTNSGSSSKWPKVNRIKKDDILSALERAKKAKADFVIVLPHWGLEYQLKHCPAQKELAIWLAQNGADVIIGAHPHVVQDYECLNVTGKDGRIRSVPVFYSIGNAVSNMSQENTRLELLVRLKFTRTRDNVKTFLEPEAEFLWCTLPGRLTDSYCTVPVLEYRIRRKEWKIPSDHDNMMRTYWRVKQSSGIEDNIQ